MSAVGDRAAAELAASNRARHRGPPWEVAALLLLAPGIALRVWRLEWMEFAGDEVTILYESYRAAHEHLALHGIPTSIGVRLPPLLLYLLALPMALTLDPPRIALFVALLNLVGLAALLALARRLFGARTAWAAAALLACAPWPVLLARKIWNPDFLFPFAIALYAVLERHLSAPRPWKAALALLLFAALGSFHASAWLLALPLAAWWVVFRVPLGWRGLALGLLATLVLCLPYLAYHVFSGFDDLAYAWNLRGRGGGGEGASFPLLGRHFVQAVRVSTGLGFEEELPDDASPLLRVLVSFALRAFFATATLATLWALWRSAVHFARAIRGERVAGSDALLALLGAVFATIVGAYAILGFPALPHYHAVLVPLPILFTASLLRRRIDASLLGTLLVALLLVAGHSLALRSFLDGLATGRTPRAVGYAPPYAANAARWREELARLFAEVDDGRAAARAEAARAQALFDASSVVLVRFDPARNEPPAIAMGRLDLEPTPEGLVVRGTTPTDMLRLPDFENEGGARIVLRLELDVPKDGLALLLYETGSAAGYARGNTLDVRLKPGATRLHLELPARDARGRVMLRLASWRYVVRAYEVRRAPG